MIVMTLSRRPKSALHELEYSDSALGDSIYYLLVPYEHPPTGPIAYRFEVAARFGAHRYRLRSESELQGTARPEPGEIVMRSVDWEVLRIMIDLYRRAGIFGPPEAQPYPSNPSQGTYTFEGIYDVTWSQNKEPATPCLPTPPTSLSASPLPSSRPTGSAGSSPPASET